MSGAPQISTQNQAAHEPRSECNLLHLNYQILAFLHDFLSCRSRKSVSQLQRNRIHALEEGKILTTAMTFTPCFFHTAAKFNESLEGS